MRIEHKQAEQVSFGRTLFLHVAVFFWFLQFLLLFLRTQNVKTQFVTLVSVAPIKHYYYFSFNSLFAAPGQPLTHLLLSTLQIVAVGQYAILPISTLCAIASVN